MFIICFSPQFTWMPYPDELLASLPLQCYVGRAIWSSSTPIIYMGIVEFHHPHRAIRQMGFSQGIPSPPPFSSRLQHDQHHGGTGLVRLGSNWASRLGHWLAMWESRHELVYRGNYSLFPVATPDYMAWYQRSTVRFMTRPDTRPARGYAGTADRTSLLVSVDLS